MATLGLGCTHQQLLRRSLGAMSPTAGFFCERMVQQRVGCSPMYRMQTASHGANVTSITTRARRSEIAGVGRKRVVARRQTLALGSSPASRRVAGEVASVRTIDEDFVAMTRSAAGFKDRADILEWKGEGEGEGEGEEEEETAVQDDAVIEWRFEFDSLVDGHVGKLAFLAILLMGVGVGCLSNVGDAEAATNHMNGNGGLDVDMRALAMGPEGPLLEEFWDNMRRYGFYFLTVVTGGVYQLVKPIIDALSNPVTAVLVIIVVSGSIYLVGLTVSAMLGINEFNYQYAQ